MLRKETSMENLFSLILHVFLPGTFRYIEFSNASWHHGSVDRFPMLRIPRITNSYAGHAQLSKTWVGHESHCFSYILEGTRGFTLNGKAYVDPPRLDRELGRCVASTRPSLHRIMKQFNTAQWMSGNDVDTVVDSGEADCECWHSWYACSAVRFSKACRLSERKMTYIVQLWRP